LALTAIAGTARAQTALEPDQGGIDFRIQGEYSGRAGEDSLGVQVIALGSGQFKAVFLAGGLPGQGWDGTGRIEAAGTLAKDTASFSGGGYSAVIAADGARISGKTDKNAAFALDKAMRHSPTEGAQAPSGAVVLFDGNGVSAWKDGTASMDDRKLFKPEGASASSGAVTKQAFQDFTLHLEFRQPFMPAARGQRRGNSGIYLQGRDEVQVLDSFGASLENGADTMAAKRECAAFFEYYRPSLNAAFPPLSWQTYDIYFKAAKYDAAGKTLLEPATASIRWNGVLVQDKRALAFPTLLGDPVGPAAGPLRFQAYGDPVFYRNIWLLDGVSAVRPVKDPPAHRLGGKGAKPARVSLANGRAVRPKYRDSILDGSAGKTSNHQSRPATGHYLISGPAAGEPESF
jgi:hypothetical protein